jgi:hypothetical protein
MKKYDEYDITPENITDEQITQLWIYAVWLVKNKKDEYIV